MTGEDQTKRSTHFKKITCTLHIFKILVNRSSVFLPGWRGSCGQRSSCFFSSNNIFASCSVVVQFSSSVSSFLPLSTHNGVGGSPCFHPNCVGCASCFGVFICFLFETLFSLHVWCRRLEHQTQFLISAAQFAARLELVGDTWAHDSPCVGDGRELRDVVW